MKTSLQRTEIAINLSIHLMPMIYKMNYSLFFLSFMAMKAVGDFIPNQPTPHDAWQNVWRGSSSIENLPIDWNALGLQSQTVANFISYLDCVDQSPHSPDECLTDDNKASARDFAIIFDTLYWFPDIEPALFNQLEKYKPKDCSVAHATCTASTSEDICPPWRLVVPGRKPMDVGQTDSGEQPGAINIPNSALTRSTDKPTNRPIFTRPIDATTTTAQTPASTHSMFNTQSLAHATTTSVEDRTAVYDGFVPTSTPDNGASSYALGKSHEALFVVVPAAACMFVALW
ncbi:hypothetical protein N0V93_006920 [Gnomoniopsis smithogilvyi]|uniref:Uncharacterized protein n=1 Tax=Gnomoniopsis smithogilvyi TaxID=1191159 RepID=A0A9W9CW61_9PEZI|nr:hypothetical protein N0V93_006920 [Gnomoniopsis smithogilvyi]